MEDNDYKEFCLKCNWNDCDYGCTSPIGQEVYQCPLYMFYHPEKVKEFEEDVKRWIDQSGGKENEK